MSDDCVKKIRDLVDGARLLRGDDQLAVGPASAQFEQLLRAAADVDGRRRPAETGRG